MSDEGPLFSRNGEGDRAGKLSRRIDVPCTEEMDDAIGAMALMQGYSSKAEFVRAALAEKLFGIIAVMRSKLPKPPNT